MGESFGVWIMGVDEEVMFWIDMVNIVCGFYVFDFYVMSCMIDLVFEYEVMIGVYFSYLDL